ncbi:hypothetical protein EUX98_g6553 [Antrodiella citrinella]|uniref:Uncharacterized protein n=1 Tax=Antrodiella citrinella TaxID=2447956 RepID=A0A4S4MQJ1_9APHY|nr:hypothetical protein EUX98_g6553 [Antrodiella citrinella]
MSRPRTDRRFDARLRELHTITREELVSQRVCFAHLDPSDHYVCAIPIEAPAPPLLTHSAAPGPWGAIIFDMIGLITPENCQLSTEGNRMSGEDWEASFWIRPCQNAVSLSQWRQKRAALVRIAEHEQIDNITNVYRDDQQLIPIYADDGTCRNAWVLSPRMRINTGPGAVPDDLHIFASTGHLYAHPIARTSVPFNTPVHVVYNLYITRDSSPHGPAPYLHAGLVSVSPLA